MAYLLGLSSTNECMYFVYSRGTVIQGKKRRTYLLFKPCKPTILKARATTVRRKSKTGLI